MKGLMGWLFGLEYQQRPLQVNEDLAKINKCAEELSESARKGAVALRDAAEKRQLEADASLGMRQMIGEVMRRLDET